MRFALALITALWAFPAMADDDLRLITVTGLGEVSAAPDMARVTLGVSEEARTANEALTATSVTMTAIMAQLSEGGIASEDMQTTGLNLSPRYHHSSNSAPEITGYVAQNMLLIEVTDLEALGPVMDAVVAAGANRFHGLTFDMQEPRPLQDEARRAAVADAREKAALYAEAAGVTLGPLQSLGEADIAAGPQPVMMEMARMASDAVPIAEGEVTLSARVTVTYVIAE